MEEVQIRYETAAILLMLICVLNFNCIDLMAIDAKSCRIFCY